MSTQILQTSLPEELALWSWCAIRSFTFFLFCIISELEPFSSRLLLNSNAWSSCFLKETTDAFPECNFSILDTRVFSKAVMASRSSWRSFSIICSAAWETWRLAVVIFVSSSCYVLSKSQITSRADLLLLFDQLRCGNDVCFSSSTAFSSETTSWLLWSEAMQNWHTQLWQPTQKNLFTSFTWYLTEQNDCRSVRSRSLWLETVAPVSLCVPETKLSHSPSA